MSIAQKGSLKLKGQKLVLLFLGSKGTAYLRTKVKKLIFICLSVIRTHAVIFYEG